MALGSGLQCRDIGLFVTDVGHRHLGAATAGEDLLTYSFKRLAAPPTQHHQGALFGEAQCGRLANARAGPGDESDLALQTFAHRLISCQIKAMPPLTAMF
ncbi:hypothetical protein D3C85_1656240 [compost metagenome]